MKNLGLFILRCFLGLTLLAAGFLKIGDPLALAQNIATYQILPVFLIPTAALSLPIFEITLGILMLSGWKKRSLSFAALTLMLLYTAALASAWLRGLPVDCQCFGPSTGIAHAMTRDILLTAVAAFLYVVEWHKARTCLISPAST